MAHVMGHELRGVNENEASAIALYRVPLVLCGCASRQTNRLHVVATISMLSTLIQDVRGDNVISQEENVLTDNDEGWESRTKWTF